MRGDTDAQQLVLMLHSARELLGVGVTTARDLGARAYLDVVVRDAIAGGLARGPRMVVAARPITVTGGHCWFMGGEADSDDDLRRMVRTHHKHGANLIKVMSTGGLTSPCSASCAASSGAAVTTCPTAAASTSAHPARPLRPRSTASISGCSPRRPGDGRRSRTPRSESAAVIGP
jgi:hypothetical protein